MDAQEKERSDIQEKSVSRLEAQIKKLEDDLRHANARADRNAGLLADEIYRRETRSLEEACALVQETLDAYAVVNIETPDTEQWTLFTQGGVACSGDSLHAAIVAMLEAGDATS